jgi:hypothetical protein
MIDTSRASPAGRAASCCCRVLVPAPSSATRQVPGRPRGARVKLPDVGPGNTCAPPIPPMRRSSGPPRKLYPPRWQLVRRSRRSSSHRLPRRLEAARSTERGRVQILPCAAREARSTTSAQVRLLLRCVATGIDAFGYLSVWSQSLRCGTARRRGDLLEQVGQKETGGISLPVDDVRIRKS